MKCHWQESLKFLWILLFTCEQHNLKTAQIFLKSLTDLTKHTRFPTHPGGFVVLHQALPAPPVPAHLLAPPGSWEHCPPWVRKSWKPTATMHLVLIPASTAPRGSIPQLRSSWAVSLPFCSTLASPNTNNELLYSLSSFLPSFSSPYLPSFFSFCYLPVISFSFTGPCFPHDQSFSRSHVKC